MPAVLWAILAAARLCVQFWPLLLFFLGKYFNFGLDTMAKFVLRLLDYLVSYAVQGGYVSSDFDSMYSTLLSRASGVMETVQNLDGVLPVTALFQVCVFGYATILSIRLVRWFLSFIPTLNAG